MALQPGLSVRVYWNLRKRGFSVLCRGRVVAVLPALVLTDARFDVQPAGRAKTLLTRRKNVHAFISGRFGAGPGPEGGQAVFYDLWTTGRFVEVGSRTPVAGAATVVCGGAVDAQGRMKPRVSVFDAVGPAP